MSAMATLQIQAVSYSYETAAAATGFSIDVIKRAVKAGDLAVKFANPAPGPHSGGAAASPAGNPG